MIEPAAKPKPPGPCSFILFGATGDLTHRLVTPALYNLAEADLLPREFCLAGIVRKPMSADALRESLIKGIRTYARKPIDE